MPIKNHAYKINHRHVINYTKLALQTPYGCGRSSPLAMMFDIRHKDSLHSVRTTTRLPSHTFCFVLHSRACLRCFARLDQFSQLPRCRFRRRLWLGFNGSLFLRHQRFFDLAGRSKSTLAIRFAGRSKSAIAMRFAH